MDRGTDAPDGDSGIRPMRSCHQRCQKFREMRTDGRAPRARRVCVCVFVCARSGDRCHGVCSPTISREEKEERTNHRRGFSSVLSRRNTGSICTNFVTCCPTFAGVYYHEITTISPYREGERGGGTDADPPREMRPFRSSSNQSQEVPRDTFPS